MPRDRVVRSVKVKESLRLTPQMVRVVLVGPDLVGLPIGEFTDHYVKLMFPPRGGDRPTLRTYTVRAYDALAGEMSIDVVVHGDEGVAGPWAAAASPDDEVTLVGPGGGYAPDGDADWHLLIGDESALPAIAGAIEQLPRDTRAVAFVEVQDAREEQILASAADVSLTWVHRDDAAGRRGDALVAAVEAADLPAGRVHAFLHGEADFVKRLRHHLRFDRGVPREMLSASGYWRFGRDDEEWRAEKAAWKSDVEADEHNHLG
jgi:NADPH-dependent ferric siderophore reductase